MEENEECRVGFGTLAAMRDIYVDIYKGYAELGLPGDLDLRMKINGLNMLIEDGIDFERLD